MNLHHIKSSLKRFSETTYISKYLESVSKYFAKAFTRDAWPHRPKNTQIVPPRDEICVKRPVLSSFPRFLVGFPPSATRDAPSTQLTVLKYRLHPASASNRAKGPRFGREHRRVHGSHASLMILIHQPTFTVARRRSPRRRRERDEGYAARFVNKPLLDAALRIDLIPRRFWQPIPRSPRISSKD